MAGRVFVTGASGFVGTAVVEELVRRSYQVNALVNRQELKTSADGAEPVRGSLFDVEALTRGMRGCEAVIHLVGIIIERPRRGITFERIHSQGTRNVVDAAKICGIERYVHMSALGARSDAVSQYHKTKYEAEQCVRASGLRWTIICPSLIHGPRGEFMRMVARWARRRAAPFLFMPYFGAGVLGTCGAGKLQPVYVGDVARAFVDALENRKTIGQVYPLGGPDQFTWPRFHEICSKAIIGKKRMAMPIPVWLARLQAAVLPAGLIGFNRDQVVMSQEDNVCDLTKFKGDFEWEPQSLEATLRAYAGEL